MSYGAIATGNRPILIRCAEHHPAGNLVPDGPAFFDARPPDSFLRYKFQFITLARQRPRLLLEEKLSPKVTDEVCSKTLRTCTT
ncbi:MAG: hypothetical protein IKW50_03295, partial [Oscillospiraceae bacterium]|nr:hypothetical protein [Oscillospiraceae bacterium]